MDTFIRIYIPAYMIIFFLFAMVFPSYRLYRRTGINPVTFGKKADTAHDYIGVLFKLLLIVIAVYGLLGSIFKFSTIMLLDTVVLRVIGLVLSVVGIILVLISQKAMSDSWRIGIDEKNKSKLVTDGAFKYIRNPIFSGMLLVLAGLFLIIPTCFMGYLAVSSYFLISIQVRLEEEYLSKVHGKEYAAYKARVGRFIPRIF